MKMSEFRKHADQQLAAIRWDEAQTRRVLAAIDEQEETRMKRKMPLSLIAALMLALVAVGAVAAGSWFGMDGYSRELMESNEAFAAHVVEVGQEVENEYLSVRLNEMVFDGVRLHLTMNITSKDEGQPIYVIPAFTATADGEALQVRLGGSLGNFWNGFWLPAPEPLAQSGSNYGTTLELYTCDENGFQVPATPAGEITWRMSLQVLQPNWPIETAGDLTGEETYAEFEAFEQQYRNAYSRQVILTHSMGELVEYVASLPVPEGMDIREWLEKSTVEKLTTAGAFTLAGSLDAAFVTGSSQPSILPAGTTYECGPYTVTMDNLVCTFSSLDFRFHFDLPAEEKDTIHTYQLDIRTDEEPLTLTTGLGMGQNADGTIEIHGGGELRNGIPHTLTFTLREDISSESWSFTVTLP